MHTAQAQLRPGAPAHARCGSCHCFYHYAYCSALQLVGGAHPEVALAHHHIAVSMMHGTLPSGLDTVHAVLQCMQCVAELHGVQTLNWHVSGSALCLKDVNIKRLCLKD